MQVNYCGAVWTIASILAGAGLNSGFSYVLRNAHGQETTALHEDLDIV